MKKLFLLAVLGLAVNIASGEDLHVPFPEGEKVVCYGDSITHGGMYPYYLQLAQLLRHPGSNVRILNAGISGGSAGGAIRRWPWDVKPMKGTTTLIVFGMNDVNRTLYGKNASPNAAVQRKAAIDRYAENMGKLAALVAADGGKVIIATPPPFDEYNPRQKSDRSAGCNEEGLATLADIGRKLAADRKYGSVELHRPLTEVLKIAGEKVYLPDRIHPGADGHLLILEAILHSLGVSPEVAYCEVNLADGKNVLRNAGVSQLKIAPEKVSFKYEPRSMPFPGLKGEREILAVAALGRGNWELLANGVKLGTFSAEELGEGVNLAQMNTPNRRQAEAALKRAQTWRNVDVQLRHLVKMDVRAMELGADPTDFKASVAAIDDWYARRGSKLSTAKYYAGLIKNYKANAQNRDSLRKQSQVQVKELVRLTTPVAYEITLKKCNETILASQWISKFYEGLEANGEMRVVEGGYKGKSPCIELRYIHGADKFGAEKTFFNKIGGAALWTVAADVECEGGGEAGAAVELFDAQGKSLGVKTGAAVKADGWTRHEWKFAVPSKAVSVSVHLLSLSKKIVRFANITVDSVKGEEIVEKPLEAYVLPSAWNKAWNGGRERFTSFADAPLVMSFHFKGDKDVLRCPAFEIEFPDVLELSDAFTSHAEHYAAEVPVSNVAHAREGAAYRKLRFEKIRAFEILRKSYGWERKLAVVLAPKDVHGAVGKTFKIHWRALEEDLVCSQGEVDLHFAQVPDGLSKTDFFVFSWQSDDRLFSNDRSLTAAVKAYEAAGVTTFVRRDPEQCPRGAEIASKLEKRGPWRFTLTFSDSWDIRFLNSDTEEFKALGVKMAERNDGKKMGSPLLCPDYFNNDPAFHAYYRDRVILPRLKAHGIKAGDMVSGDLEPWGAKHFCVCERCLKAFAEFKGLEKTPGPKDVRKWPDDWAMFRCLQTETSVAKLAKIVRGYNPGVKVIDYDYVIWYGHASERAFMRGCSKNAAMNDKWLDGHICSFYHTCDRTAFNAIRNNTGKLLKPYIPLGAIAGAGSYLRDGEVRNPAQIRQLALAAAVHGCPGIGFYKGIHYDGEHLLALMKARDEIAAVEKFGWGKNKGALTAESTSSEFIFATASAGKEEVIALFNYEKNAPIVAKIKLSQGGIFTAEDPVTGKILSQNADLSAGFILTIPPGDVKFVKFTSIDGGFVK